MWIHITKLCSSLPQRLKVSQSHISLYSYFMCESWITLLCHILRNIARAEQDTFLAEWMQFRWQWWLIFSPTFSRQHSISGFYCPKISSNRFPPLPYNFMYEIHCDLKHSESTVKWDTLIGIPSPGFVFFKCLSGRQRSSALGERLWLRPRCIHLSKEAQMDRWWCYCARQTALCQWWIFS